MSWLAVPSPVLATSRRTKSRSPASTVGNGAVVSVAPSSKRGSATTGIVTGASASGSIPAASSRPRHERRNVQPDRGLGVLAGRDLAEQHRRAHARGAVEDLDARVVRDDQLEPHVARGVGPLVRDDDLDVAVAVRAQRLAGRVRQRRAER